MKIAFIGQKGIPVSSGGVERRVEQLSVRMAEMGHDVFVYSRNNYTDKNIKKYRGVNLIHLPSLGTKNLDTISHTFFATIHALFRHYDIIHYQAPGPSTLCWIIKIFKRRTALVATFNCPDRLHQKWGWLARKYLTLGEYVICKVPDKTLVVTDILKKYAKEVYGAETTTISNGSAIEYNPKTQALKRWDLKEKKYLLVVSRLIQHKGVHYLIEAFKQLENTSKLPTGFKLVIVGEGFHTDEYVQYLKKISAGRDNIIFTGTQNGSALEQLFSHAYLFVQPSEVEGLSNALLETMGCGVAPLISNIEENVKAVQGNGFVFQSKSISDLEEKLAYLLNQPEEVSKVGQDAKDFAEKEYSWNSIARRTLKVYENLILEKREAKSYVWKHKKA